jgi:hypothetical protein
MHLERNLTRKAHIKAMENKAVQHFVALCTFFKCQTLNRKLKTHLYKSLTRPILLHGASAWGYAAASNMKKLQAIQNKIIRSTYDRHRYTSIHIALGVRTLNEKSIRQAIPTHQATRQPDHSSTRILRHPHALLEHETKADLTIRDHKCRQPASDALASQ